tara:strand:+ start:4752 stop:4997 length:246 start_codon:yes stop_codon:yes gene_type:complete
MSNKTNIKVGKVNYLRGKSGFNVKDLIKILNLLEPNALINFGVINSDGIVFSQDDNFIFDLDKSGNIMEEYDTVNILTNNK